MRDGELNNAFLNILIDGGALTVPETIAATIERVSYDTRLEKASRYILQGLGELEEMEMYSYIELAAGVSEEYDIEPEQVNEAMTLCEERIVRGMHG